MYETDKDGDSRNVVGVAEALIRLRPPRSLEPLPTTMTTRGATKSAVSRRFVARTRAQLEAWPSQPLDGFDLVGLILDVVHVGEHA
jgi:hypothetical protein